MNNNCECRFTLHFYEYNKIINQPINLKETIQIYSDQLLNFHNCILFPKMQ